MSSFLVFFSMTAIIFLYSYILGGGASILLLYMLVMAPLISVIITSLLPKRIVVYSELAGGQIEKDGVLKINVIIENKSVIPVPFLDITFMKAINFSIPHASTIRLSLGSLQKKTITMKYTAIARGACEIGIEKIVLRDFIGLININMQKYIDMSRHRRETKVLPRMVDIKPTSKIIMNLKNSKNISALEEVAVTSNSYNGELGYECREYIPGDSLQKVHWKLSAKKDILMVRKEQSTAKGKKLIVIDPLNISLLVRSDEKVNLFSRIFSSAETEEFNNNYYRAEDKLLEAVLSVTNTIINVGIEAIVYLFESDQWIQYSLKDVRDVIQLRYKLSEYKFINDINYKMENRIPLTNITEQWGRGSNVSVGELIVFTANYDYEYPRLLDKCLNYNINVDLVCVKESSIANIKERENFWVLSDQKDLAEVFS